MNFDEAFLRINGRKPTDIETKDALALADVLKRSDLDPMLLLLMADAKAKGEREQFVADMRSIATETIATIREGLPTSPEWAKAAAWAEWFSATMHAEATWLRKWAIVSTTIIVAIIFTSAIFSWRDGYSSGWTDQFFQQSFSATRNACAMLDITTKSHPAEAAALRATETKYGCAAQ